MPQVSPADTPRAGVRKTYKLYIGGAFPRSESGYSYVVNDSKGNFVANAALASRKDARDAVVAARKAFGGWSARSAYNRAQIVYRIAEVLEDRRAQFVELVRQGEGLSTGKANDVVNESVDRLVWYAGWADKITQVTGSANPVAAPFFNLSSPEPTGVVAIAAPQESSLLGLVSVLAPVIVTGNTAVVVSSYARPLPAVNLAEVLATSDVPGGVVNILTGDWRAPLPWLASHMDVNALDLTGVASDVEAAADLEATAAENLKRVLRAPAQEEDWYAAPGIERMTTFLETKTVWHPVGI
ncbi:aldehyde dehydrogenase family protein [Nocardioides daphniae]|uniref:Aldehyde dehydrogenase family protein n=1 Tax=Nocardioides daphniae TaxID=402297 RepID=A0A4P7UI32_9ACTN|nr:aldehyde dehydrogenase family protein [Nocardioides daphniae]